MEATLAILGNCKENLVLAGHATEALWYLAADYDQTQLLIRSKGHGAILSLARNAGTQDAVVANNVFKLLANTLYCEDRNSSLWADTDFSFVFDALGGLLVSSGSESK